MFDLVLEMFNAWKHDSHGNGDHDDVWVQRCLPDQIKETGGAGGNSQVLNDGGADIHENNLFISITGEWGMVYMCPQIILSIKILNKII